jgi:hypothetical protein
MALAVGEAGEYAGWFPSWANFYDVQLVGVALLLSD